MPGTLAALISDGKSCSSLLVIRSTLALVWSSVGGCCRFERSVCAPAETIASASKTQPAAHIKPERTLAARLRRCLRCLIRSNIRLICPLYGSGHLAVRDVDQFADFPKNGLLTVGDHIIQRAAQRRGSPGGRFWNYYDGAPAPKTIPTRPIDRRTISLI